MAFTQPELKYAYDALEPHLSERAVTLHYDKHTAKYFDTTNKLIKGTIFEKETDLAAMLSRGLVKADTALYNNACQAWNHIFFFEGLAPANQTGQPSDKLREAIKRDIGGIDDRFKEEFIERGVSAFGSSWCWLILRDNTLAITTTPDASNPLSHEGALPLMCIDGWEHAWYLDYEYDKQQYFIAIWHVINWNKINERFAKATS